MARSVIEEVTFRVKPGEMVGLVMASSLGGAIASWKTIPMYTTDEMGIALETYKKLQSVYKPPS